MNREKLTPQIKTIPPGVKSRKWTEYHMKDAAEGIYFHDVVWDRSKPAAGPFFSDPDGNIILDFSSHGAAFPLGYNNQELIETAKKAAQVAPQKCGAEIVPAWGEDPEKIDIPMPSHLIRKISSLTQKFGLDKVFLSNSGSEAIENALKVSYDYRRNMGIGICFERAFHGRTLGAASLTRSRRTQRSWYPHINEIIALPFCSCKDECRCGWMVDTKTHKGVMSRLAELLDPEIGVIDPEQIAYIIVEAIQGEGGYNIPGSGFLEEIASLAKKYQIPLIVDEIQSGLGRTGKWFAFEHFGIEPDVISLGKTLCVGATVASTKLFPKEQGRLGGTWGGADVVSAAVGYQVLNIIERENLLDNAQRIGSYLLNELKGLGSKYKFLWNARGLGLMVAISVDGEGKVSQLVKESLKRGLLIFSCGNASIRFMPPLDVNKREADLALEILDKALAKV